VPAKSSGSAVSVAGRLVGNAKRVGRAVKVAGRLVGKAVSVA
jgi:hypothetical protein